MHSLTNYGSVTSEEDQHPTHGKYPLCRMITFKEWEIHYLSCYMMLVSYHPTPFREELEVRGYLMLSMNSSKRLVTFTAETPESKSSDTRLSCGYIFFSFFSIPFETM